MGDLLSVSVSNSPLIQEIVTEGNEERGQHG
jgi:hypothetical protein